MPELCVEERNAAAGAASAPIEMLVCCRDVRSHRHAAFESAISAYAALSETPMRELLLLVAAAATTPGFAGFVPRHRFYRYAARHAARRRLSILGCHLFLHAARRHLPRDVRRQMMQRRQTAQPPRYPFSRRDTIRAMPPREAFMMPFSARLPAAA